MVSAVSWDALPNQSEAEDAGWGWGEWDRNKILWAKSLALTLILLIQGQGLREFGGLW